MVDQSDQPIGDLFILSTQLGLIGIAGLAHDDIAIDQQLNRNRLVWRSVVESRFQYEMSLK